MTKQETMTPEGGALAIVSSGELVAVLKDTSSTKDMLERVTAHAREEAAKLDADTKAGRAALVSLANDASKSRAEVKRQAMAATEQWRKDTAAVNAGRKVLEDGLAALRDEIRNPVTEWEAREADRIAKHQGNLAALSLDKFNTADEPGAIAAHIETLEAMNIGADWDEFAQTAKAQREAAVPHYKAVLAAAEKRVADEAELERLRAEAAERARRDAEEAERRQEAQRRAEAEKLAAAESKAREEREAARLAQIERDKVEAAQKAAAEAEARAAKEAKERDERHARELAEAKAREVRAAQAERDRIAAERKAEAEARAKREADAAHRESILTDIREALAAIKVDEIPQALLEGRVPHVKVML